MYSFVLSESGHDFEGIRDLAPLYLPFEYQKYAKGKLRADGAPGFSTPSGRAEFYSLTFDKFGINPLPEYVEPPISPYSTPELYEKYPLVLTTGARRWNTFHAENREAPHLRAIHPEPTVQINPKTAQTLGLTSGEWVWVEGPCGLKGKTARAKRVVEITPIMDARVVNTDHAWWHPEGDPENLYDVMELNINNLISWDLTRTGIGAGYKSHLCKIYRVKDGE
jgi:anaerobic selenocysteine-containing dehydrogenase